MNATRIASLLRELADALEEDPKDEEPSPEKPKPRAKVRAFPAPPPGEVSDLDMRRAREMLRRKGML